MKYQGTADYDHTQTGRVGVLLTNLGTPQAPEKAALRPYLKQFLSDPRVVEVPRLLWWFILNGIILNVRPARSAEAYRTVWTDEGSPLLIHTRSQAAGVAERLKDRFGEHVVVDYAMRYGQPAIDEAILRLSEQGARRLLVLPLYPQYSGPTSGSTFDAVAADFVKRRWIPDFQFVASYHDHPGYIEAVAESVRQHWRNSAEAGNDLGNNGRAERLVFSYHGEPRRYLDEGDPYHCQCHKSTRLIAEALGLQEGEYLTSFQSRFGREEWLKPYTDETLRELASAGVKSVQVVCPGFSSDCLETIEEIGIENRDYFLEAGGERYEYIPCLNAGAAHLEFLSELISSRIAPWLELPASAAGGQSGSTADMAAALKTRSAA